MEVREIHTLTEAIRGEVRKAVVGQDDVIDFMLTSLLVGGHILLEGVPGTAKTLLAQSFAASLAIKFGRIQFTPDLMPGDVLGTNLFNFQTNSFVLTKGPIFTELLLADEINRTPPKTQAALLQAMNERKVTIDGATMRSATISWWSRPRTRSSSRAPIRCPRRSSTASCSSIVMPIRAATRSARWSGATGIARRCRDWRSSAFTRSRIPRSWRWCANGRPHSPVRRTAGLYRRRDPRDPRARLARGRRLDPRRQHAGGGSARLRGTAGRDFVIPDDVKTLALPVLRHRVILSAGAEIEGLTADRIVGEILSRTAAPR